VHRFHLADGLPLSRESRVAAKSLMGGAFGLLFLGGLIFGAVWLVLPHPDAQPSTLFPAVLVFAVVVGLVLLAVASRLPERHDSSVLAVRTTAISVAFYLT
jgi:lipopolysaccharide export LptBFGC system permease protein LptF